MSHLLRADIFRVRKSRLTLVAFILALAFPALIVFMYVGDNDFPFVPGSFMTVFCQSTISFVVISDSFLLPR